MLQSLKLSQLMIRLGLALVFFWFGIDKFIHPEYWTTVWLPPSLATTAGGLGLSEQNFVYLVGLIEVLVGTSLVSTLLMRVFSIIGVVLLVMMIPFQGFSVTIVQDVGLVCALVALIVWPERRFL